jgi:peptidylprolyl isomerase
MLLAACALTAILAAGCGPSVTPTPTEIPGALPREHAVSAADLQVGEGTDICDQFPTPELVPYKAPANTPFSVVPGEPQLGPDDALITIIAYLDLGCADCTAIIRGLQGLSEAYPDEVRIVWRHLPGDPNASLAAEALEAAAAQGGNDAFWKYLDVLADHQPDWHTTPTDELVPELGTLADLADLDGAALTEALNDRKYKPQIDASLSGAGQIGIPRAPMLFFNDLPVPQPPTAVEDFSLITEVVLIRLKYAAPPPMVIDPAKDYSAWIVTEKGTMALDLFADLAPVTVNNFAYLACVGYYDNLTWHRVVAGQIAQAGDPTGLGVGGPGYTVIDEFAGSGLRFDRAGWLSMAHTSQPNSAGGQFFITVSSAEHLNGAFTIFGEVVSGMDVAQSLTPRDPQTAPPDQRGDALETIVVRQEP